MEEQKAEQEEAEGEQMEECEEVEVEEENKREKEVGACCHEKETEEQRTKKQMDDGWRFEAPSSCEAPSQLTEGSTSASGIQKSWNATLMNITQTNESSDQDGQS